MKTFEIKLHIEGGYKNETSTHFVQAKSKTQLLNLRGVAKVYERKDITSDQCDMDIVYGSLCYK